MESIGNNAAERLRGYVERVARLETQRRELAEDVKEILIEVKSSGLKPETVRALVKEALMDDKQRAKAIERKEDLEMCRAALGGLADMPLGEAALAVVR